MKQRLAAVFALLVLVTALPLRAADEPYDFYAILEMTGPAAFLGRGESVTLQAAEKFVNAHGGIRGRPLHIIVEDDQSNAAVAVQLANQIIAKGVPAFIGPGFGATCTAVEPLIAANGPVMYCISSNLYPPNGGYGFVFMLTNVDQAANALRYIHAKGYRKLGFLSTTDTSGQDNEKGAFDALKYPDLSDMKVVANEHFGVTDISALAQVSRIKAAGADVLCAWTTGTAMGTVLRAASDSGFDGIVLTGAGNAIPQQLGQYASFLPKELIFTTLPFQMETGTPAAVSSAKKTFLDAMHQVNVDVPNVPNYVPWDPMMILVGGLRKIGPQATAAQMRDYIMGLHDFPGINGFYDFRRGDQRGLDPRSSGATRWNAATGAAIPVSRPGGAPL